MLSLDLSKSVGGAKSVFLCVVLFIAGCGGGGGDDEPSSPAVNQPPATLTANAGADQTVNEGLVVTLTGSASHSVTYAWTQIAGPSVTLGDANTAAAVFTAPQVSASTALQFRLTVTRSNGTSAQDTVQVTVLDVGPPPNAVTSMVLAGPGLPAPGLSVGNVISQVDDARIGRNGHVILKGRVGASVLPAGQGEQVIWAGLPNQLAPIARVNDLVLGLPGDVSIGEFDSFARMFVSANGSYAFTANLQGAGVTASNRQVVLTHVNGVTRKIYRQGESLPGYSISGVGTVRLVAFSDAGAVLDYSTSSLSSGALWLWDANSQTSQLVAGWAQPLAPGSACLYGLITRNAAHVSDSGDVVFGAHVSGSPSVTCPARHAYLHWRNGAATVLVSNLQAPPGIPDSRFNFTSSANSTPWPTYQLSQANGVIFRSSFTPTAAESIWIAPLSGEPRLIALRGERVPGSPIRYLDSEYGQFSINEAGRLAGVVALDANSPGVSQSYAVVTGFARDTVPYAAVTAPGDSQLSVLTRTENPVPGMPGIEFNEVSMPLIDGGNNVLFDAALDDGASVPFLGVAAYTPAGVGRVLIHSRQQFTFNGVLRSPVGVVAVGVSDINTLLSTALVGTSGDRYYLLTEF